MVVLAVAFHQLRLEVLAHLREDPAKVIEGRLGQDAAAILGHKDQMYVLDILPGLKAGEDVKAAWMNAIALIPTSATGCPRAQAAPEAAQPGLRGTSA